MLTVTQVTGCILTPKGWVRGTLTFDRRITLIDGDATLAPGEDERLVTNVGDSLRTMLLVDAALKSSRLGGVVPEPPTADDAARP